MRGFLHSRTQARCARAAFTLIELLLVIAIIGVLVAVVAPQLNVGMSGARVRTGAMAYMQASRYARTMAVLYQMETELMAETGGVMRVEARPSQAESRGPFQAPADEIADAAASAVGGSRPGSVSGKTRIGATGLPGPGTATKTPGGASSLSAPKPSVFDEQTPEADVTAAELAGEGNAVEAIRVERVLDGVHIRFLGYTDEREDRSEMAMADEPESFRIRYRSNGICRPHRVRITDDAGQTIDLSVDMLGLAVVEGEEDR